MDNPNEHLNIYEWLLPPWAQPSDNTVARWRGDQLLNEIKYWAAFPKTTSFVIQTSRRALVAAMYHSEGANLLSQKNGKIHTNTLTQFSLTNPCVHTRFQPHIHIPKYPHTHLLTHRGTYKRKHNCTHAHTHNK